MTYESSVLQGDYGAPFAIYELAEPATDSHLRICPERGGMVVSFAPYGRELLYLDPDTFADTSVNVRGGIPVLWPICGQLDQGTYQWNGQVYRMANHGLARRFPWTVADVSTEGPASITLRLTSNDATIKEFPFAFELTFTYQLQGGELVIQQTYTNHSAHPMPMYAGFHPYFRTAKKHLALATDATAYFDYNDGMEHPFSGDIDLVDKVESVVLTGTSSGQIAFSPSTDPKLAINLEYSHDFKHVVLWSVQGKPFVCVEPWMALSGSMNSRQGLTLVAPGQSVHGQVRIWAQLDDKTTRPGNKGN